MADVKTYVPNKAAGDWILGKWRPEKLLLTERQAEYELARRTIRLEGDPDPTAEPDPEPAADPQPAPVKAPIADAPADEAKTSET